MPTTNAKPQRIIVTKKATAAEIRKAAGVKPCHEGRETVAALAEATAPKIAN